jgi:hypothetical protein
MPTRVSMKKAKPGEDDDENSPTPGKLQKRPAIDFLRVDAAYAAEDTIMTQPLYSHGFDVVDVLGDGNCGFYSCLLGLEKVGKWKLPTLRKSGRTQMYLLRKQLKEYLVNHGESMIEKGGGLNEEMGISNFAMYCCADINELETFAENTCLGPSHPYYTKSGKVPIDEQYMDQVHGYAIAALFRIVLVAHNVRKCMDEIKWSYVIYDGFNTDKENYANVTVGIDVPYDKSEDACRNHKPFMYKPTKKGEPVVHHTLHEHNCTDYTCGATDCRPRRGS